MAIENLSLSSFIKEIKEVTEGAHPRRFCFVLGAGASRNSGIKSGQDLVKIWDNELQERNQKEHIEWRRKNGITDENMFGYYSQYYEKRFCRCPSDGYNYIEKIMESAKPSAGYVMLAHILTRTPHNVVITTNFDHLTEDAVNYYAQSTPLVIGHESLAHYISAQPVRPTIIKIHRDLLFDPKSKLEDLKKLPDNWKNSLELLFSNYHPIFIGYAGNDKNLMDFLIENGDKFAKDEWKFPYWMLYNADTLEGKVENFLEKSKGYCIFHDGFDNVMLQLGAYFDYKIPAEEEFLQDAKKRYKELSEAIAALSDRNKKRITEVFSECVESEDNFEINEEDKERNQAIEKIVGTSDTLGLYMKAQRLSNQEKYDEACEIFTELIKNEPNNTRYHRAYSDVLVNMEKFDLAIEHYNKAIELEPDDADNYCWKACAFVEAKQYNDAIVEIKKAIDIEPKEAFYYFVLANSYELMGNLEEARINYEKCTILSPEDSDYNYFLGCILKKQGELDDAFKCFDKACHISPEDDYYYELGNVLLEKNKYTEAIEAYEEAKRINPDNQKYSKAIADVSKKLKK